MNVLSAYSTVKGESANSESFPPRTLVWAAGAGGVLLGVVLTAVAVYVFSAISQDSPPGGPCSTANPLLHMGCQVSQPNSKKIFTIFAEEKKNWYEALADCHRRGMLFAAIENEEEFQQVLSLIHEKNAEDEDEEEDFWLSGTDLGHNGTYVWMSTGREITFTRWFHDEESQLQEPTHGHFCDDQPEHCMELMQAYHYEMNDNCCNSRKSYVCESLQCFD